VLPLSAVSGIESAQVSRTSLGHYWQMKVEVRGFPHLAKNERDVGPTLAFVAGTVPKKSQALLMNNRTLDRPRALDGLRPSFSAPRSLVEHGALVECAVARTVHSSLNLPQASQLLDWINRKAPMSSAVDFGCLETEVDRAGAKEPYEDCRL
jgi:hypothetical protein